MQGQIRCGHGVRRECLLKRVRGLIVTAQPLDPGLVARRYGCPFARDALGAIPLRVAGALDPREQISEHA